MHKLFQKGSTGAYVGDYHRVHMSVYTYIYIYVQV